MKILHTSDWHLGRTLYGKKRYWEFKKFLNWLLQTIQKETIDTLLVAGDIFDTTTPSHQTQLLYYQFISNIAESSCRTVIFIGGNHDSPSLLNAPKTLLSHLNIFVIGSISDDMQDDVLVLNSPSGEPELIVCAVPYLRDRDIRQCNADESIDDKSDKFAQGIQTYYHQIVKIAEQKNQTFKQAVPIIAMGHLFTAGTTLTGEGVRDLYIGSLEHIKATAFPEAIDYLALGHLHIAQKVANCDHKRYSGSPIPMGFGEANQQKIIIKINIENHQLSIDELNVPCFQKLAIIKGDFDAIVDQIKKLIQTNDVIWLEVIYQSQQIMADLTEQLNTLTEQSNIEILRIKIAFSNSTPHSTELTEQLLDTLNETDVFQHCLDYHQIPDNQQISLNKTFNEVLKLLQEEDSRAV